jgi:hypothetical protein
MLASTLLAIPFVPVFWVLLERMSERLRKGKTSAPPGPTTANSEGGEKREPSVDVPG